MLFQVIIYIKALLFLFFFSVLFMEKCFVRASVDVKYRNYFVEKMRLKFLKTTKAYKKYFIPFDIQLKLMRVPA